MRAMHCPLARSLTIAALYGSASELLQQLGCLRANFGVRAKPDRVLKLKARFGDLAASSQHAPQIQAPFRNSGLTANRFAELLLAAGVAVTAFLRIPAQG